MVFVLKLAVILCSVFLIGNRGFSLHRFHFAALQNEAFAGGVENGKVHPLDFGLLAKVEHELQDTDSGLDVSGFPLEILALHGKTVKVTGYLLIPYDAYLTQDVPLEDFAVGKNAYGCPCCAWGPPPTIMNTVFVKLKKGEHLEPPFTPTVEVTGTFAARREYYVDEEGLKQLAGLFFIQDATVQTK